MSIPWLGCSFTTVNVRALDAPISKACQDWDLDTVRFLLETKQASIYDVDDECRLGLLEVRRAPACPLILRSGVVRFQENRLLNSIT